MRIKLCAAELSGRSGKLAKRKHKRPSKPYTGPTTGIRVENSEGLQITGGLEAHGFDRGIVLNRSPNVRLGSAKTTAPVRTTAPKPWWKVHLPKLIVAVLAGLIVALILAGVGL